MSQDVLGVFNRSWLKPELSNGAKLIELGNTHLNVLHSNPFTISRTIHNFLELPGHWRGAFANEHHHQLKGCGNWRRPVCASVGCFIFQNQCFIFQYRDRVFVGTVSRLYAQVVVGIEPKEWSHWLTTHSTIYYPNHLVEADSPGKPALRMTHPIDAGCPKIRTPTWKSVAHTLPITLQKCVHCIW